MASKQGMHKEGRLHPKSMRHKRILDSAAEHPDASLETIAEDIPSATADLVENVLEEYGDPAEDESDDLTKNGHTSSESSDVSLTSLTDAQRETLRAIQEHPDATQRELGEILGVTASTICNRIKTIEGFEWHDRHTAVESIDEFNPSDVMIDQDTMSTNNTGETSQVNRLKERVAALEAQVDDSNGEIELKLEDFEPELVQKVMHACFDSEKITEDEELQLLNLFL